MVDGALVQVFARNHRFHHLFHDIGSQVGQRDFFRMLHRDDDGVHSLRYACSVRKVILAGNLYENDEGREREKENTKIIRNIII